MTRTNAMRYRLKLNEVEVSAIRLSSTGLGPLKISRMLGVHPDYTRQVICRACKKLGIEGDNKRQRLALYWKCELFRLGLREKGLL